jgi:hypothetical protein
VPVSRNTPSPLGAVSTAFRLLTTGPRPLALHGASMSGELPDRLVPVNEIRALLLRPGTSTAVRNQVWAELVRRALAGSPAWTVALAGVALPGLYRAVASLTAGGRTDRADLETEVLAGFLAELRRLDPDDLAGIPLASRLVWAAYRAGARLAWADAAWAARRSEPDEGSAPPPRPWGHPDFVLAAAVCRGVITAADAELIGANRLEGIPLRHLSARDSCRHDSLRRRRARAEKKLTAAVLSGDLSFPEFTGSR